MSAISRLVRPLVSAKTYRALAFYLAELVLGIVGFVLLLAAWPVTVVFAITPLVIPILVGLRLAVGLLAKAEGGLARELLRVQVDPPISSGGRGFWDRGLQILRDVTFWKQQAHLLIAWPIALVPIAVVGFGIQLVSILIWYPWADSSDAFGLFDIDTFAEALPVAAVGLAVLVVAAHLLGPYAALSRRIAAYLLSGEQPRRSPAEVSARRLRALTVAALGAALVVGTLFLIWFASSGDYFWPVWPLLAISLVIGVPGWVILVLEQPEIRRLTLGSRALAIQVGISVLIFGFLVAVWAITTGGYFWPIWPGLALALLAGAHAVVVYAPRSHRMERLERSHAAAVDVQESDLRRIERDLHDGAQARLVALGMSIGMAEEKLDTDPEAARALLAEARTDARNALEELRDLARGIHPPILTDRGIEAAVTALSGHSPVPVSLAVDVAERPAPPVETAAYFVVAEALANAIKHADATRIDIRIRRTNGMLLAEVEDDGHGGANPAGNGLAGLERRVRALQGTLTVESPAGGPTTVRVELPCA
jgi:signal transduction histidine kinase